MGPRCNPVRDRWEFFRRSQGPVQASHETLGKLHLRQVRREGSSGAS